VASASAQGTEESAGDNGQAFAGTSIVKGTTAPITSFPWLAHIAYRGPVERFDCSGTVVAPRLVLTAGHCVLTQAGRVLEAANFRVVTGLSDLKLVTPSNVSAVSQVLLFPGSNPARVLNDAALLVLAAPVTAPAIPLAGSADGELLTSGTPIVIAGWGLTNGGSTRSPTVLRSAMTVIQDQDYCRRKSRQVTPFFDPASQFCAIAAPKFEVGSCHGDSGGPGIAQRPDGTLVQVGIISLGANCKTTIPELQTRVDGVSPWVANWIATVENGAPAPAVFIPPIRLPRLDFESAKFYSYIGLAADFRNRFVKGFYKRIGCGRVEREKVKCRVFWFYNGSVYTGSVTVFYAIPREGPLWNFRYRIRKFNANCWAYSRTLNTCPRVLFYR
jgi:hypothetical protein